MALKSWLASLKADVSNVSGVQAPIHADLGRYVTETAGVSAVSGQGGMVAIDTADTAGTMQAYQAQPAWALVCTPDTCKKINTQAHAENDLLLGDLLTTTPTGPRRIFRQRGPWLTGTEQSAAQAYHAHHFNCPICIAAGRGNQYGERCAQGLALWIDYTGVTPNMKPSAHG